MRIAVIFTNIFKEWLKSEESEGSGWSKDDGSETIGHDSGRNIVQILEKKYVQEPNLLPNSNILTGAVSPKKDPSKYSEDDIAHMRKVVSYCKRHLGEYC